MGSEISLSEGLRIIVEALTAIGLLWTGYQGWRNGRAIEQVHEATNSKMDKLLTLTAESSEAKGLLKGQESQAAETYRRERE